MSYNLDKYMKVSTSRSMKNSVIIYIFKFNNAQNCLLNGSGQYRDDFIITY